MELHPTLWRTCRVLSGTTRLRLLRLIHQAPGLSVSEVAVAASISIPRASQELRRLNSRGFLQPVRRGPRVSYLLAPDPQVPDAAPIVETLRHILRQLKGRDDNACRRIARAFSHSRRLAILKELLPGPLTFAQLKDRLRFSRATLKHHLTTLRKCRMLERKRLVYMRINDPHPLAECIVRLVRKDTSVR